MNDIVEDLLYEFNIIKQIMKLPPHKTTFDGITINNKIGMISCKCYGYNMFNIYKQTAKNKALIDIDCSKYINDDDYRFQIDSVFSPDDVEQALSLNMFNEICDGYTQIYFFNTGLSDIDARRNRIELYKKARES